MKTIPEQATLKGTKVKFGIDPTYHRLHLGHLVALRVVNKMAAESKAVTIVLGTYTATLGDPSGRTDARPILTEREVDDNAKKIKQTLRNILSPKVEFYVNSRTKDYFTIDDIINIMTHLPVKRMLARDSFKERLDNNKPLNMHELLVPVMQALDSVVLNTEIEIGGIDQLTNFTLTRDIQAIERKIPQECIMVDLLLDKHGNKMSKSNPDTCIFLDDSPEDIFIKVMAIPDSLMEDWIPLLSDIKDQHKESPIERKKLLAHSIVEQIYGINKANIAKEYFDTVKVNKEREVVEISLKETKLNKVVSILMNCSLSEASRLISQGAVRINDEVVLDTEYKADKCEIVIGNKSKYKYKLT